MKDFLGNEYGPGDMIVYARGVGSHGVEMVLAKVVEVVEAPRHSWSDADDKIFKVKATPVESSRHWGLWPGQRDVLLTRTDNIVKTAPPPDGDLGMFTIPLPELADRLADYQHSVCAYGTRDGDGRPCDCKYGADRLTRAEARVVCSEQTGCPELRMASRLVRRLEAPQ